MKRKIILGLLAGAGAAGLIGCAATATTSETDAARRAAQVLRASFASKGMASLDRLDQDDVQRLCTEYAEQAVPPAIAERIQAQQLALVKKPASGKLIGDWKAGEKIAQEGRGMQFSDAPDGPRGGNCYACHQLSPQEISFGNIGPSLLGYGKLRGNSEAVIEYTYNKVYNSQAYSACSNMPRFGHKRILSPEQIADVVALLLDPQSPVNK
ncbi:MAG TPA: sulfur oxidation c-type cytochrome SoxX [Paucimonas sp.]|nr:sulfur oxidation c-type cytochrome SoxX [Paucimonas sp.]